MALDADYLALDDKALLAQCDVHLYRSSGPGGQHRNKVSSAVRLRHRPTSVTAHGDDSRSQHQNKAAALRRLRMNIACRIRRVLDLADLRIPPQVCQCIFRPRGGPAQGTRRLEVGRKDQRFWTVAAFVLDLLEACGGRLADAGDCLDVTTANLAKLMRSDPRLFTAAQDVRKKFGQKPLT